MIINSRERSAPAFYQPQTQSELIETFRGKPNGTSLIAGGTSQLPSMLPRNADIVDLSRSRLDYIVEENRLIKIGAMCTVGSLELTQRIHELGNGIILAGCSEWRSKQIKNRATVGGAIASSPYGGTDLLLPLLVLESQVVGLSMNSARSEILNVLDANVLANAPDHKLLITEVVIQQDELLNTRCAYSKIRPHGSCWKGVSCAVAFNVNEGKLTTARIAVAVSDCAVFRMEKLERRLINISSRRLPEVIDLCRTGMSDFIAFDQIANPDEVFCCLRKTIELALAL